MKSRFALVPALAMAAALSAAPLAAHAAPAAKAPAAPAASTAAERAYFAKNAKATGVIALPGLQYQILESGPADGESPSGSDEITARYTGTLMDGTVFDSSGDRTISFTLRQVIPGWQVAMKLMRPGDKWKLFIPAYLAYGPAAKPKIPADSPLIFEVELVSVAQR
jgi:peptidylprolyl isomerase/FKBP-type peptidyl-prolyl cis-trans isomerase FklB